MKTQARVLFVMLFAGLLLTSCGAFVREKENETISIDEQAATINNELDDLAKELAQFNCDYSKLIAKVMDGDMEAEQKAYEINDRILELSRKVESLVDAEDPDAVAEWAELYSKHWSDTDCE